MVGCVAKGDYSVIWVGKELLLAVGIVVVLDRLTERGLAAAVAHGLRFLLPISIIGIAGTALGVADLDVASYLVTFVIRVRHALARRVATRRIVIFPRPPSCPIVYVHAAVALWTGTRSQVANLVVSVLDRFAHRTPFTRCAANQIMDEVMRVVIRVSDTEQVVTGVVSR